MANATFYFEWLGVDKNQFRILSLLAPNGEFRGNLSDMCRSLNLALQTRNRKSLKSAISALIEGGYITSEQKGNTISLKTIPQKNVIEIPSEWLEQIMNHNYTSESIAWQMVLKVLLWLCVNQEPIVTRDMIAGDINCGVDTITSALNVLERDFNGIIRKAIKKQNSNGDFRCIGLELTTIAWWD